MDPRLQQNRRVFLSDQNESMLYGMLSKNFQQRLGSQLNEKQSSYLERSLEFYMSEVIQSNPSAPIQSLNKEVLSATASEFNDYLQRGSATQTATPQMFEDASQRFEQAQQERQRSLEAPRPAVPDYISSIPLKEDDSVSALSLFEEAKKRRNMEMNVEAETQIAKRTASASQPIYTQIEDRPDPRAIYDKPLDLVIAGQNQEVSGRGDVNSTLARPGTAEAVRGSLPQDVLIKQQDVQSYKEVEYNLSIYSADRKWDQNIGIEENRFNFSVNFYSGNPTNGLSIMPKGASRLRNIVRIEFVKAVIPIEVTEMVVRKISNAQKPDLLTTFAIAQSIAMNSASAGNPTAMGPTNVVSYIDRFIEYQNLVGSSRWNGIAKIPYNYDTDYLKNVYAFPFLTLNVSELDTNTYGTNSTMDNAFGILQYDSNWTDNTESLGFTSLIPKHMKCQRVYSPTPLATLNKLTIRLQQPNGQLVNSQPDTVDVSGAFLSVATNVRQYLSNTVDISGTGYTDLVGEYIWLDCKQWFSRYQISVGDRIQLRNLKSNTGSAEMIDFLNYVKREEGHTVVGTAYIKAINVINPETGLTDKQEVGQAIYGIGNPNALTFQPGDGVANSGIFPNYALIDGNNTAGYSRFIIIRSRFMDPTQGLTLVSPFGGKPNNTDLSYSLYNAGDGATSGKLINLSRQTQFIFRVITREYDSSSLVRPDNL